MMTTCEKEFIILWHSENYVFLVFGNLGCLTIHAMNYRLASRISNLMEGGPYSDGIVGKVMAGMDGEDRYPGPFGTSALALLQLSQLPAT
jgi:hypothetical protein